MHKPKFVDKKVNSANEALLLYKYCTRKRPYKSKNIARNNAQIAKVMRGEYLDYYKCRFGKHWHIGHNYKNKATK